MRFPWTGLQACWALVAAFQKVGGNGGLCVWPGTTQLCHLSICLSCQTLGKVPLISSIVFSARLGGLERGLGPNHCANQRSTKWQIYAVLSFFFSFSFLPSRKITTKQTNKKQTHFFLFSSTPCSFTRKKEDHRATFIHKVSIQLSLLVIGSGFS